MKTKLLLALALSVSIANVYAQADSEERVLNSDPIDVDGYLHEKNVTDGELEQIKGEIRKQKNEVQLNKEKAKGFKELSKTTEKLSETTEEYLDEKQSAQKDIAEYNKKIKCLMEQNPGPECDKYVRNRRTEEPAPAPVVQEVQVQAAAPAVTSEVEAPVVNPEMTAFEEIKMIPYAGATQYNGDVESLEAEIAAGLRLESNINSRFSMGIGFNYAQFKTDDFANNLGYMFDPLYQNAFGSREMQYRSMGLDIYGKFFITRGVRFKPYVGAGLGLNRATLSYSQNDEINSGMGYGDYTFGNEEFKSTYTTGQIMAGSEIMVTPGFGINIEGSISSGIGDSLGSSSARNTFNSPDQQRLNDLGKEVINARAMSIFVGGVFIF